MRLSTIALVLGFFAIAGHMYATLFSIATQATSPAAWPTFLDARRVIKTVSEPMARSTRAIDAGLTALPAAPMLPANVVDAIEAVSGERTVSGYPAGQRVEIASVSIPPLPIRSPELANSTLKTARSSIGLPSLHARVTPRPAAAIETLPATKRPGVTRILTGSILQSGSPEDAPQTARLAPVRNAAPRFDGSARNSLGGPVPPPVVGPVRVAALAPDRHSGSGQRATKRAPVLMVAIPLPELSPGRMRRDRTANLEAAEELPALRSLAHSLSFVRNERPGLHLRRRPDKPARMAALVPPLPPKAPAAALGVLKSHRARVAASVPASNLVRPDMQQGVAADTQKREILMGEASQALRLPANDRVRRAGPVISRAVKVSRKRAIRAAKERRRARRRARRHYASTQWKRRALGESLY